MIVIVGCLLLPHRDGRLFRGGDDGDEDEDDEEVEGDAAAVESKLVRRCW